MFEQDLHDGIIHKVHGITTLDGVGGWAVVTDINGTRWAYAPRHVTLITGEIARTI